MLPLMKRLNKLVRKEFWYFIDNRLEIVGTSVQFTSQFETEVGLETYPNGKSELGHREEGEE